MNKPKKRGLIFAAAILGALILFIGSFIFISNWFDKSENTKSINQSNNPDDIKKEKFLNKKAEIKKFPIKVLENRENELVFDFTLDDFIDGFNGYYYRNNKKRYILPASFDNWQTKPLENAIHSPYEATFYNYSADRKMWSLPTVSAYIPTNTDRVEEIVVNFDWHSYSDNLYEQYNEMCYCALKVFFPDLSDKQIKNLYTKANQLGYDNIFPSDQWYSENSVPYALFYKDGIGVYSHFAIGSTQKLCIIPVNENILNELKEKGTEIFKIDDM